MISTTKYCTLLLLGAVLIAGASGFGVAPLHPKTTRTFKSAAVVLYNSAKDNAIYTPDNPEGVTPNQIKDLRKEASKRLARKELATQFYAAEDATEAEQQELLSAVCADLEEFEMLQVRGVSRNSKRQVFDTANQLADDLTVEMKRPVFVVVIKGHAVTLYCGSEDESKRKILLRSSYQEGVFELRMKAERDHRGQIVKN